MLGRRLRNIDIHTITYRHTGEESSFSDAEFSAGSIKRRREQATIAAVNDWSTLSDDKIARIAAILKE